jgi:hypothetical protein
MTSNADPERELLRHTIATLAYRGGKVLRGATTDFSTFRMNDQTRTPVEILAHIGDLLEWGLSLAKGKQVWNNALPQPWEHEVERFFEALRQFDSYLASGDPLGCAPQSLFQGPIADALTHVGQIAMLRRIAGIPIRGENYFQADIVSGKIGADQSAPRFEFD